jgi:hypothetical protein
MWLSLRWSRGVAKTASDRSTCIGRRRPPRRLRGSGSGPIDDAVCTANEAWAIKLRDNRNIGDFRPWKDHDAYQKALGRLLRDLRVEPA